MIRKLLLTICLILTVGLTYPLCTVYGADGYDQVASSSEMASDVSVGKYGMTPVYGRDIEDGSYDIKVDSSSSFFHISKATLNVKGGKMTTDMTLSSTSYKFVYLGTPAEAAKAPLEDYIEPVEKEGEGTFSFRVSALDKPIECAAFSKKKKKWYPRQILFDATTLPAKALRIELPDYDKIEDAMETYDGKSGKEDQDSQTNSSSASNELASYEPVAVDLEDGEYSIQVNMTGGSGRASVTSPTWLIVKDGKAYARLMWSSTYYDYMIVGNKTYLNETTDGGNSTFTIPIAVMDDRMPVIADTTAMGDPVEIEYQLTFYQDTIGAKSQIPQEAAINVLIVSVIIIVIGGILNIAIKRQRKQ
ncbi:MAG: hypothetical protein IJL99_07120 [Firmicutes bacterium]|nr:hypothetical protein [Bacillota bacterium]